MVVYQQPARGVAGYLEDQRSHQRPGEQIKRRGNESQQKYSQLKIKVDQREYQSPQVNGERRFAFTNQCLENVSG